MSTKRPLVDVEVWLWHETEKAALVSTSFERSKAFWIPKSQAEFEPTGKTNAGCPIMTMTLPEWLAIEKRIV